MRFLLLTLLLTNLSCNTKKESAASTPAASTREAPALWTSFSSAKSLQLSVDFDAAETTAIGEMADKWEDVTEDKKDFFTFGSTTPELTSTFVDLDALAQDNVFGVYKTTDWPTSMPGSALAVTQLLFYRHNTGTANEYIDIQKADILVNYDLYNFDTAVVTDMSKYDLRTVVLHEMGHFLGLGHKARSVNRATTVMYPSISTGEMKRTPKAVDANDLAERYSLTLSQSGGAAPAMVQEKVKRTYTPSGEGEPGKMLIELHVTGECVHKIDGVVTQRHRVDLK